MILARSGALFAASMMLLAPRAMATIQFQLDNVWNGSTPTTTGPWLTADFTTIGSGGAVQVTLTGNMASSTFIDQLTFNIASSFTPSSVAASQSTGPTATFYKTTQNANGGTTITGYGNDKGWDFVLKWPTSNSNPSARFSGTDTVTFTLTAAGLTEDDFKYFNATGDKHYIAAHIMGFGSSGAIDGCISTVPEPSTFIAGAMALVPVGLGVARNWRRKNA